MAYSDVGCVLKININCDACKMKLHEVLSSIVGAYSVAIDADEGLARISGEIDPNILMKAISRNGKHVELKWLKLSSPTPSKGYNNNTPNGYGSHGCGHRGYGALDQGPYGNRDSRMLPDMMAHEAPQNYYPNRPVGSEYPNYHNRSSYGYETCGDQYKDCARYQDCNNC